MRGLYVYIYIDMYLIKPWFSFLFLVVSYGFEIKGMLSKDLREEMESLLFLKPRSSGGFRVGRVVRLGPRCPVEGWEARATEKCFKRAK